MSYSYSAQIDDASGFGSVGGAVVGASTGYGGSYGGSSSAGGFGGSSSSYEVVGGGSNFSVGGGAAGGFNSSSTGSFGASGGDSTSQIASDLLTLNAGSGNNNNNNASSSWSSGNNQVNVSGGGYSSGGSGSFGVSQSSGFDAGSFGVSGGSSSISVGGQSQGAYVSEIESSILRSTVPITVNESEEITVNGQRGIWANRSEVINWRGTVPITQYVINEDSNPEIITKRSNQTLEYLQELAIRYLRPPAPPAPGEIIIQQQANFLSAPAPPIVIRQQPARPSTPEPIVIREAPPQPPAQVGRKLITISGKAIPPPPRKVIIERLAPLPAKPQCILVERWLPYSQVKRRVIFQRSQQSDAVVVKPRNVIVQWEAPRVNIRREIKYLGVINANPVEYVQRYGSSLKVHTELPQYILDIKAPDGLVLAADFRQNQVHELEGDLQALRLVDLNREGLSEYSQYLQRLGISYDANAVNAISAGGFSGASGSSNVNISSGGSYGGSNVSGGNFGGDSYSFGAGASSGGFNSSGGFSSSSSSSSGSAGDINAIFDQIDRDNNGFISVSEAESVLLRLNSRLGRRYGEDDVRAFFARLDVNRDGKLSVSEFRAAFNRL